MHRLSYPGETTTRRICVLNLSKFSRNRHAGDGAKHSCDWHARCSMGIERLGTFRHTLAYFYLAISINQAARGVVHRGLKMRAANFGYADIHRLRRIASTYCTTFSHIKQLLSQYPSVSSFTQCFSSKFCLRTFVVSSLQLILFFSWRAALRAANPLHLLLHLSLYVVARRYFDSDLNAKRKASNALDALYSCTWLNRSLFGLFS